jgi:hypothetical protein
MNESTTAALLHNVDLAHVAPSRRGVFAAIAGGLFASLPFGLGTPGVEAKGKKGRKGKSKNKKKPRGPQLRADATCPGPSEPILVVGSLARLAQTFTAETSGPLVKAELDLEHRAEDSGEYILRLSPVDGAGVPTDEVLAAALVSADGLPGGVSTVTFTFHDPASVEAVVQYALVLVRFAGKFGWAGRDGDACVGRAFLSDGLSAPFELRTDQDFVFTTFVRS